MIKISGLVTGRSVHYVLPDDGRFKGGSRHVAAVITRIRSREGNVNLTIFCDEADFCFVDAHVGFGGWIVNVPYDPEGKAPGTWHFPEEED